MKTTKTLKEIIDMYDHVGEKLKIHYRTYTFPSKCDLFIGMCFYDYQTGELIAVDHDNYNLDDKFFKWEMITDTFSGQQFLQVWYDSEWV